MKNHDCHFFLKVRSSEPMNGLTSSEMSYSVNMLKIFDVSTPFQVMYRQSCIFSMICSTILIKVVRDLTNAHLVVIDISQQFSSEIHVITKLVPK